MGRIEEKVNLLLSVIRSQSALKLPPKDFANPPRRSSWCKSPHQPHQQPHPIAPTPHHRPHHYWIRLSAIHTNRTIPSLKAGKWHIQPILLLWCVGTIKLQLPPCRAVVVILLTFNSQKSFNNNLHQLPFGMTTLVLIC
jgi:hypothetical protein